MEVVARRVLVCLLLMLFSACQSMPADPPFADGKKIDRLLVLIDQRLAVAEQVAQSKWNSGAPINDPARESRILDDLTASPGNVGDAGNMFMRRFFQAQFDAGKIIQQALHAQWRQEGHARFANPPDLARDIRPELDRLTPLLIAALNQVRPLLQNASARLYLQRRGNELVRGDVGGRARAEALRVLLEQPPAS